jgi:DNA-binding transcriptional regulator YiaG
MPNIASILKEEIIRVARKEIRNEIASLRKAVTTHRSDIAELKRRALAAEKERGALNKARTKPQAYIKEPTTEASAGKKPRFSAKGLASNRTRLGLSAEQFGLLVGVASQSIYNWEAGESQPRERYLAAIAELRTIGKKEASARLQALKQQAA